MRGGSICRLKKTIGRAIKAASWTLVSVYHTNVRHAWEGFDPSVHTIVIGQGPDKTVDFKHQEPYKSVPFGDGIRSFHVSISQQGHCTSCIRSMANGMGSPISAPDQTATPKDS